MKAKRTKKNDLGLHKVRAIFRFRAWVIHALFEDKFVFCTHLLSLKHCQFLSLYFTEDLTTIDLFLSEIA